MSYLKTKGIVIKEVNIGEADKIITLFTLKKGKLTAFVKGARRQKSKLGGGTQFLCYSEFILFEGREKFKVNSCEVIENFYRIRNDLIRLTYAAHIVDIINDVIHENQPSVKVLQLFLNTLYMLANTDRSPELIARIFELRLLSIIGFAPHVDGCVVCGIEKSEKTLFSFRKCGFICGNARCTADDPYATELKTGTVKAIFHIVRSNMDNLFSFDLSPDVLRELSNIVKRYLKERLERDYTKLDFLKNL